MKIYVRGNPFKKSLALVALTGLLLIATGLQALAQGEEHTVILNTAGERSFAVTGTLEFTNNYQWGSSRIYISNGVIDVPNGAHVKIVVNASNRGKIWIGNDGWITIHYHLPVEAIYVNNELKASNTEITRTINLRADLSSLKSTLRLEVPSRSSGWTQLIVDDHILINDEHSGHIMVYNLKATTSRALNLNIVGRYFSGVAEGIEYDGNVIGVSEFPWLPLYK